MIYLGLGSNLDGPWGTPRATVLRALKELDCGPIRLVRASELMVSAPFGRKNQPDFVNAVAQVATHLSPQSLLLRLHAIERRAGRQRRVRWGPRTLDLDLLDYRGLVRARRSRSIKPLVLPHSGITSRLFVLRPLQEIAPRWRHPLTKKSVAFIIHKLTRLNRT
jgi:2-amino-4-hydroxy-6-hydroxymethyldihydropteridine diphosphokinase